MSRKRINLLKQELELLTSNPTLVMEQKGWTKKQYIDYIEKLEEEIEKSRKGKSKRNKGSNYERTIAKIFKSKLGIELRRTPQSGGFAKNSKKAKDFRGDIIPIDDNIDFKLHIECKNHSNWSLPSWIRQAEEDCPEDRIPVVVFHRRQKNVDGKRVQESGDYICLRLEDFLNIVNKNEIIKIK